MPSCANGMTLNPLQLCSNDAELAPIRTVPDSTHNRSFDIFHASALNNTFLPFVASDEL